MKFLVILSAVAACAFAKPGLLAAGALGYATPFAYAAPLSAHTQYHAQDVLGQATYGHAEAFQTHNAIQDAAGNKIGSFSYLSPEGNVFRTDYVADALGYRVASNALPVGPSLPVADTPEVAAAKIAHLAAKGAVIHRARRQIIGHTPAATAPLAAAVAYAAPVAYTTPLAAPIAYHGAALRPGILTNIVNTPGHAVSYRVD